MMAIGRSKRLLSSFPGQAAPPYRSCCLATGFCYFVVASNLISNSTTTVLTHNHIANPFSLTGVQEDPRNGKLRSTRQVQRPGEAN